MIKFLFCSPAPIARHHLEGNNNWRVHLARIESSPTIPINFYSAHLGWHGNSSHYLSHNETKKINWIFFCNSDTHLFWYINSRWQVLRSNHPKSSVGCILINTFHKRALMFGETKRIFWRGWFGLSTREGHTLTRKLTLRYHLFKNTCILIYNKEQDARKLCMTRRIINGSEETKLRLKLSEC